MNDQYAGFFTELENRTPYFKVAAEGQAGTGKTYTLALTAVGLYKKINSKKPIVIFDTEESAKFLSPLFKKNNIEAIVKVSRTLPDLTKTMRFCHEGGADILFIDSITHVWETFLSDYQQKKGRDYIQFQDWAVIKPTWKREFSDKLVRAKCHILFTGREGFTYDYEEVNGKRELVKTGVKMKAEGETAYEPDLLLRMERFEQLLDSDNKEVWREATVIKDRSTLLDGRTFKNPTFTDFEPVVDFLLDNPQPEVDTVSHPNADLIKDEEGEGEERKERKIFLERNNALLDEVASGTSKDAKALRLSLVKYAYHGETSDLAITSMNIGQLQEANERLNSYVDVISKIYRGESKCYPMEKVIMQARAKYVGSTNLGDVPIEELEGVYLKHLIEKAKEIDKMEKAA